MDGDIRWIPYNNAINIQNGHHGHLLILYHAIRIDDFENEDVVQ
jgi:hypothetical protein